LLYIKGDFDFHYPPPAFLCATLGKWIPAPIWLVKFAAPSFLGTLSPKKTWEGLIGILISAGVAFIISIYFKELPWNQWVSMAILISCWAR